MRCPILLIATSLELKVKDTVTNKDLFLITFIHGKLQVHWSD